MSTTARVTYDQFEAMIRRGEIGATDDRYELLLGEIRLMPWPKPSHEFVVDELTEWSFLSLPEGAARIRTQQTLGIPALDSLTLPDVAWMRRRDYSKHRPQAEDVLLLIEVADSTLSIDRNKKGRIYAGAGIADSWLVNLRRRLVEVRRDPRGGRYREVQRFATWREVRPPAFPDVALPVARLFPG